MDNIQLMLLSAIQGLTEFLPVSSSGHLILLSKFTSFPDQGLAMDIAIHVGSLFAVIIYLMDDLIKIVKDSFKSKFIPNDRYLGCNLFWYMVVATIPVVIAGYLITEYVDMEMLRSVRLIGWTIMGFGILLYIADKMTLTVRRLNHFGIMDALVIGLFQVLALIPGTSRSGITMTAARFLGFERKDTAKFSMLIAIPTIIASAVLIGFEIYQHEDILLNNDLIVACFYSFITCLSSIYLMMWWLARSNFTPFVIYRIVLGGALLAYSYGYI